MYISKLINFKSLIQEDNNYSIILIEQSVFKISKQTKNLDKNSNIQTLSSSLAKHHCHLC